MYIFYDIIIDISTRAKSHVYKYLGGLMFYDLSYFFRGCWRVGVESESSIAHWLVKTLGCVHSLNLRRHSCNNHLNYVDHFLYSQGLLPSREIGISPTPFCNSQHWKHVTNTYIHLMYECTEMKTKTLIVSQVC